MRDNSTIAAIATPPGSGAIAIIRMSGENAIKICSQIFEPSGNLPFENTPANTVRFGLIKDAGLVIDEVLVTVFRSPKSYTGEDSVEISCHGSTYIQQKILNLLISHGARSAQPGEFTQRAFLNGKIDLSQAEAIADLIASSSEAARRLAMSQLRGGYSEYLQNLRTKLLSFVSLIELELDFAEEDVEFANRDQLKGLLADILLHLRQLTDSFELGNALKNGIPVAIVGRPNVGKSTLLNTLINEEKAIVSSIPGTTRDAIEDTIKIQGVEFRFIDTAGLREANDEIEQIGIKKSYDNIDNAQIVIFMTDEQKLNNEDLALIEKISRKNKKLVIVANKTDLHADFDTEGISNYPIVSISAKHKKNIESLKSELLRLSEKEKLSENHIILTNARHYEALTRAIEALERVDKGLMQGIPTDLIAQDIREIIHYIGEITGQITTDEILGNIFENFCIGK